VDPNPSSRFELLAEGGVQSISNIGGGLFSNVVAGGNATLPYFGARGSLSALLGRSHTFLLGWWLNVGSTLVHTTVNPTVQFCFLGCSTATETHDVGGWTFSTGLRLGAFVH
jgi:hypothetical protein